MNHMIRTSERRSFRGCRRRWDWAYRQGYVPTIEPKPLEFGRAFHVAMEEIYNPETWDITTPGDKLRLAKQVFELECEKQRAEYLRVAGVVRLDREEQDDYDSRIVLGHGMLDYYVCNVHMAPGVDDWFRPVKVEIEFEVPITDEFGNNLHCYNSPRCGQTHENGATVTHGGRVDALVEDIVHGGYWIVDWKTASELRATEELLEMDDQICTYAYCLREKLGIDIRGFIYVEIRKAYPLPPKKLSRVRNGCLFSTDKRQPTTPELYASYVAENDSVGYAGGFYDEFISWLKTSKDAVKFHQRFSIEKTPLELTNIGLNLAEEVADMIGGPGPRIYPSVGRFSCPTCAFKSPCRMKFGGDDYLYTLETIFKNVKSPSVNDGRGKQTTT